MIIILQLIKPAHTKGAWFGGDFVEHLDKHPNLKKKIQEVPDSNGNAIIMISKELSIGRHEENDIPFLYVFPAISSRHAKIFQNMNKLWVEDLKSRNGTFILKNNHQQTTMSDAKEVTSTKGVNAPVKVLKPEELKDGDKIILAPVVEEGGA